MGKKASLSVPQRSKIVTLHDEGYSERLISIKCKVSRKAVHTAIENFKLNRSFADKKRSGRPKKTTPRDDNRMKMIVSRSPCSSIKKVQGALAAKVCHVSSMTISRRLRFDFGLSSRKPARKPLLTKAIKDKRLKFAKAHQHWTSEDWSKVLFSDESCIQQFAVRKQHVRRPKGKRFGPKYTVATMKHPPSQMIWGAMSAKGTAGLYFLTPGTTINGAKYLDLLKDKLKLHMDVHVCYTFMHDGAPCHKAKVVTSYLKKEKVEVLPWPGNSPDLNPIENLWKILKDKVAEKQPTSAKHFCKIIKEVWVMEMTPAYCQTLIHSMPSRIEAVIKNGGGHTKY